MFREPMALTAERLPSSSDDDARPLLCAHPGNNISAAVVTLAAMVALRRVPDIRMTVILAGTLVRSAGKIGQFWPTSWKSN
jgi:hypothetical protein